MKTLYKAYLLCLPFGTLFNLDWGALSVVVPSFSTLLMLVGVAVLVIGRKTQSANIKGFTHLYLFMLL